jgi:hypothetical protein
MEASFQGGLADARVALRCRYVKFSSSLSILEVVVDSRFSTVVQVVSDHLLEDRDRERTEAARRCEVVG